MKKYLIDQSLFLIGGIGIMICIPFLCGPIFTFVYEFATAISWGYLCRRILLFPFDLINGAVTDNVCFAVQAGLEDHEFFKKKQCPEWKFYSGNKSLVLLVPFVTTIEEKPKNDEKLRITYYRFSKILLSYDPR